MSVLLRGIGRAIPERSVDQAAAADAALRACVADERMRRVAPRLYATSGVDRRYSVLIDGPADGSAPPSGFYGPATAERPSGPSTAERMAVYEPQAPALAVRAASAALGAASLAAESITHLVTVSCSGFAAPGIDAALIRSVGLRPDIARTNVGFMGCHGALNGLRVAKAFVEADSSARALVVAVELCSLHYQYEWTPERVVSNALFADGAAAAVLDGVADSAAPQLVDHFATILPDTADAMSWRIGDHGFEMTLSPLVPAIVARATRAPVEAWLARHGLTVERVAAWGVHPGGPRILDACVEGLGLGADALDASRRVLAQHGNMSSPTVLFVLEELLQAGVRGPCVLLGFGPGLAIEAALLEI